MYQVYKNVFLTKGYNRTLIYDSLKAKIHFLPNEMYDILLSNNFTLTNENVQLYEFLNEKGIIHEIDTNLLDSFINLDDEVEIPYDIATLVIELSESTSKNLFKLVNQNILQYNFIFAQYTTLSSIEIFASYINECESDTIELTFCKGFMFSEQLFELLKLTKKILLINNFAEIDFNDTSLNKNRYINDWNGIHYRLSINFTNYLGSLKYHTYFSKKMFIGKDCEIRNSSETKKVFGYLNEINAFELKQFINNVEFKKYWEIKKEDTLICHDCEFKRLCVDNRLPTKNKDIWVHDEECEYNPYISKWSHEEGYLSLSECGISVTSNKVIYNRTHLEELNNDLWDK